MERISFNNHYLTNNSIETDADNSNKSIEVAAENNKSYRSSPGRDGNGSYSGSGLARLSVTESANTSYPDQGPIPNEVDALIDNKMYRNKFKKLIREGQLANLMKLAEVAHTKPQPSRWFATVTAKANWERTLQFLSKLFEVQAKAERVASRISSAVTRFIYQQIWRGVNVERWADTAAEVGRHKAKYFTWLCKHHGVGQKSPVKQTAAPIMR